MHVNLGGYHVRDVEFTAAFDVVKGKVGEDLADAIWAHPNDTIKFADVPQTGIKVSRGMTHDGLGKYLSQVVEKAPGKTADVVGILKETKTDVVVNYLPVGSEAATKWYAEQVLEAGCAMVNCMPVFIAREDYWGKRFEEKGLPIIGDDIKSQVGATITHRVLTSLFRERGVHLDKTMQLNVGGNSDFLNMLESGSTKKISKTNAVTSMLDYDLGSGNVHVGPSDYVPWLTDRKWAYIRMEGSSVRRRAAQRRAEARGLGLPELGRHRDRRRPAREARAQQPRRGRARRPELVPDEVAAEADRRRRGVRADRGVHPRERAGRGEARGSGGGLDADGRAGGVGEGFADTARGAHPDPGDAGRGRAGRSRLSFPPLALLVIVLAAAHGTTVRFARFDLNVFIAVSPSARRGRRHCSTVPLAGVRYLRRQGEHR